MTANNLSIGGPRPSGLVQRQSTLFVQTSREVSGEDPSLNAQLLTQAGFINRLMAGVFTYLPLGNRVLSKIEGIIRSEMLSLGASEITMPAMHPKEIWEQTGRWDTLDILFRLKGQGDRDLALGPTHEEVITPLMAGFIHSYKQLPTAAFQIQTKFRNEARAKSGLLRGREFRMKDLYSFHLDQADLDGYYEKVADAYRRIFERCGIGHLTYYTAASGGAFSKYSHEFQTITPHGEDTIYCIPNTKIAINKEILDDAEAIKEILPAGISVQDLEEKKAIEVGNIFKLGTRFSEACKLSVSNATGGKQTVIMGCYGLGPSRVMGTIVECLSDGKTAPINTMVWPAEVAPYPVHIVSLARTIDEQQSGADQLVNRLASAGVDSLYDDRMEVRAGAKFADSDLFGIPVRVVVSQKAAEKGGVEVLIRGNNQSEIMSEDSLFKLIIGR